MGEKGRKEIFSKLALSQGNHGIRGLSRGPEAWVAEDQALGPPSAAFPEAVTGNWIGSRVASWDLNWHSDVGCWWAKHSFSLTHYATAPASISRVLMDPLSGEGL